MTTVEQDLKVDLCLSCYKENSLKKVEPMLQRHPHLEADDCLAITAKHICDTHGDDISITIITSDTDYLQICKDPIRLIN